MKPCLALMVVFSLAIGSAHAQPNKKVIPPSAEVTVTDHISGFARGEEKPHQYRLATTNPDPGTELMQALSGDDLSGLGRQAVAFSGKLGFGEVVVGQTNSIPPRNITASVLQLIAGKATPITRDNAKSFPPVGKASVRGLLLKNPAPDKEAPEWLLQNGDTPIYLIVQALDGNWNDQIKVIVTGKFKLKNRGKTIFLEVETMEAAK